MRGKAPLRTRVLRDKMDWEAMTGDQVIAAREKVNRMASSRAARIVTGLPDRRARIKESSIDLPNRRLTLRVHRPKNAAADRLVPRRGLLRGHRRAERLAQQLPRGPLPGGGHSGGVPPRPARALAA